MLKLFEEKSPLEMMTLNFISSLIADLFPKTQTIF